MAQRVRRLELGAAVGKAGQRVGQGIDATLHFPALLRHGKHDEGKRNAQEQCPENDTREPETECHPLRFLNRHGDVER
jgi:hypothetical protein